MADGVDGVPLWVTIGLSVATLVLGNLVKPLFDTRASSLKSAIEGADQLRSDMMAWASQIRSENEIIRQRNDDLFAYNVSLLNLHIDFRSFVLSEVNHADDANEDDDRQRVREHLHNIREGAQRLSVETPWAKKEAAGA